MELKKPSYIVVAQLLNPVQRLLTEGLFLTSTEVPGTEVGQVCHQEVNWRQPQRLLLLRHRIESRRKKRSSNARAAKRCWTVWATSNQALADNQPQSVSPLKMWRQYNPWVGCQEGITTQDSQFALPKLNLNSFSSTEAVISLAILSYSLSQLVHRHLGCLDRLTASTLRFRLFTTWGIISQTDEVTTIRLAVITGRAGVVAPLHVVSGRIKLTHLGSLQTDPPFAALF